MNQVNKYKHLLRWGVINKDYLQAAIALTKLQQLTGDAHVNDYLKELESGEESKEMSNENDSSEWRAEDELEQ